MAKKLAVFTFGRFNPPTKGHELLITSVKDLANSLGGDGFIFPSPSEDSDKVVKIRNPLSWKTKIKLLKELFGDSVVEDPTIRSPHDVINYLSSRGYEQVVFVVGSDRKEEFQTRWLPYAEKEFQQVEIRTVGHKRDKSAQGIAGYSGTKARQAVINNSFSDFRTATGWQTKTAEKIFSLVKQSIEQRKRE